MGKLPLGKLLLGKMYIWEFAAFPSWGSCHLGNCNLGKCTFGKLPLWKLHIWEVAIWENTLGKLPLGKRPLGKYLTSLISTLRQEERGKGKKKFNKKEYVRKNLLTVQYILTNLMLGFLFWFTSIRRFLFCRVVMGQI